MFSVNAISPVQFTDKQWTNKDNWFEIIYYTGLDVAVKSSESTSDEGTDRIQYVSGSSMHCYAKPKNEGELRRIHEN